MGVGEKLSLRVRGPKTDNIEKIPPIMTKGQRYAAESILVVKSEVKRLDKNWVYGELSSVKKNLNTIRKRIDMIEHEIKNHLYERL